MHKFVVEYTDGRTLIDRLAAPIDFILWQPTVTEKWYFHLTANPINSKAILYIPCVYIESVNGVPIPEEHQWVLPITTACIVGFSVQWPLNLADFFYSRNTMKYVISYIDERTDREEHPLTVITGNSTVLGMNNYRAMWLTPVMRNKCGGMPTFVHILTVNGRSIPEKYMVKTPKPNVNQTTWVGATVGFFIRNEVDVNDLILERHD